MSYQITFDEIDGCLIVADGKRTVKVERFATDGIREVYGGQLQRLRHENIRLWTENAELTRVLHKVAQSVRNCREVVDALRIKAGA